MRYSQLSSTSRRWRAFRTAVNRASSGCIGVSRTPSTEATTCGTSVGSINGGEVNESNPVHIRIGDLPRDFERKTGLTAAADPC
jgi:hypothetical protein